MERSEGKCQADPSLRGGIGGDGGGDGALRRRIAGHRGVGTGRFDVADEGPGEHGAERAERDRTQVEPATEAAKESPSPCSAWKAALVAASASEPATIRSIASTPEAMPTFSPGIAAIAAVDIGA